MTSIPSVSWIDNSTQTLLHGYDAVAGATDKETSLGVLYPQTLGDPVTLLLRSSAFGQGDGFVLANVKFYLGADDPSTIDMLLNQWPSLGAGVDISFDRGITWTRFSAAAGNPADSSTWVLLQGKAISSVAPDGKLTPLDSALLTLRVQTPVNLPSQGLFPFQICVDCDVW